MPTHTLAAIDAHVGGQPLRLITEGLPRPVGDTMARKAAWMASHVDRYRGMAVIEPRGHHDLTAALLTEPATTGAHAGLLFMDQGGYPAFSGHGVVAAVTVALERGLLVVPGSDRQLDLTLDTAAGTVAVRARFESGPAPRRVGSVVVTHPPAFVYEAGRAVTHGTRQLRVDLAFCGAWFAICDSEATGLPLDSQRLPALRSLGTEICASLNSASPPAHPLDAAGLDTAGGVSAIVFTGLPTGAGAHLQGLTVGSGGSVDRSASGGGVMAVMAVLDAMGLLLADQTFVFEGLSGSAAHAGVVRRTQVGEYPALVAEIEDSAWITGEHTLLAEADDPWKDGLRRRR